MEELFVVNYNKQAALYRGDSRDALEFEMFLHFHICICRVVSYSVISPRIRRNRSGNYKVKWYKEQGNRKLLLSLLVSKWSPLTVGTNSNYSGLRPSPSVAAVNEIFLSRFRGSKVLGAAKFFLSNDIWTTSEKVIFVQIFFVCFI